jgi:hypothetical protein
MNEMKNRRRPNQDQEQHHFVERRKVQYEKDLQLLVLQQKKTTLYP